MGVGHRQRGVQLLVQLLALGRVGERGPVLRGPVAVEADEGAAGAVLARAEHDGGLRAQDRGQLVDGLLVDRDVVLRRELDQRLGLGLGLSTRGRVRRSVEPSAWWSPPRADSSV